MNWLTTQEQDLTKRGPGASTRPGCVPPVDWAAHQRSTVAEPAPPPVSFRRGSLLLAYRGELDRSRTADGQLDRLESNFLATEHGSDATVGADRIERRPP